MAESSLQFSLNFFNKKPLKICEGIAACFTDNRDQAKVKHPLNQLISQRVYQITAGYREELFFFIVLIGNFLIFCKYYRLGITSHHIVPQGHLDWVQLF